MKALLKSTFGLFFWIHLILIVLSYFSPFLFDWKIIMIGAGIFMLQNTFFKDCVLTAVQFGKKGKRDENTSFHSVYLGKIGIKFSKERVNFWNRFNVSRKKYSNFHSIVIPVLFLVIAIVWQIYLGKNPLLF